MTDNLEALFDEIVAQNASASPSSQAKETDASGSDNDELQALFDEVTQQNTAAAPSSTVADANTHDKSGDSDELETLFDEIAQQNAAAASVTVQETADKSGDSDDLEALFDEIAQQNASGMVLDTPVASEDAASAISDSPTSSLSPDLSGIPMYDRLGTILRQLHNSLRELGYDRALQDAVSEVNDTRGRLEYVATLTEQAATRVLNLIDIGLPQQESLHDTAVEMEARWKHLFEGNLDIEQFKLLALDSQQFFEKTRQATEEEKARLMEMMMAQDFQDITGQIIKKVIAISSRLEQDLAQLLRDNAPVQHREKPVELMEGPSMPNKALVQDDVDSLLATLGF